MYFKPLEDKALELSYDLGRIRRAYSLAFKLHQGQVRKSGEPFILHPIAVSLILLDAKATEDCVVTGLLHDVLEDTHVKKEYIAFKFGDRVADIVDLLSKSPRWQTSYCRMKSNLDEMELSWAKYPEAIVVKMADRIHNLQTISGFPPAKQDEYLLETTEVLLPLFKRIVKNNNFHSYKNTIRFLLQELLEMVKQIKPHFSEPKDSASD